MFSSLSTRGRKWILIVPQSCCQPTAAAESLNMINVSLAKGGQVGDAYSQNLCKIMWHGGIVSNVSH